MHYLLYTGWSKKLAHDYGDRTFLYRLSFYRRSKGDAIKTYKYLSGLYVSNAHQLCFLWMIPH